MSWQKWLLIAIFTAEAVAAPGKVGKSLKAQGAGFYTAVVLVDLVAILLVVTA